jgi:hypothetical protein
MARILSLAKQKIVSDEWAPRKIVAGPFRGIRMNLNLTHQTQIFLGLFERETHPWVRRLSENINTAIDIGAAHGEYTLFFLRNTTASQVYAFEPDATMLSHLKNNLELNPEANTGRLILYAKFLGGPNSAVCLDTLAERISLPCFIKMDVDGAEAEILSGATVINALPDIRWLIETHSTELERACVIQLECLGFKTKIVRNAWWRYIVPEQRPIAHNRWLVAWK